MIVWLVIILLLVIGIGSRLAGGDGADGTESESSVWSAIPSWQYSGRHAESGGITRSEQEKALQDIKQQAERIESGAPDHHDPGVGQDQYR